MRRQTPHDAHDDAPDDDAPVGRLLTRREALSLFGSLGTGGLAFIAGCVEKTTGEEVDTAGSGTDTTGTTPPPASGSLTCAAKPALTEGPYFVDERLNRSDIRANTPTGALKTGVPFSLTFNVSRIQSSACTPLVGAYVDVWHCDAAGVYSDAADPGFNTKGQNWLRGYQITDANGTVKFTTIFPGWYQGRAVHIHFKIRQSLTATSANDFTSQLFFDEAFLAALYASTAPYSSRADAGRLRNAQDGIFTQGGSQLLLVPAGSASAGLTGIVNMGLYA